MQLYCFLKSNLLNSNSNFVSIFILRYIKVNLRCDLVPIVPFALASNFTKSNTPPWVFSPFVNCTSGTKSRNASHLDISWVSHDDVAKLKSRTYMSQKVYITAWSWFEVMLLKFAISSLRSANSDLRIKHKYCKT